MSALDLYEEERRKRIGGAKPYVALAGDILLTAILEYFEPEHTRRHREARDFLYGSHLCRFLLESLDGEYQALVEWAYNARKELIRLRRRDPAAAGRWWSQHYYSSMPRSPFDKMIERIDLLAPEQAEGRRNAYSTRESGTLPGDNDNGVRLDISQRE